MVQQGPEASTTQYRSEAWGGRGLSSMTSVEPLQTRYLGSHWRTRRLCRKGLAGHVYPEDDRAYLRSIPSHHRTPEGSGLLFLAPTMRHQRCLVEETGSAFTMRRHMQSIAQAPHCAAKLEMELEWKRSPAGRKSRSRRSLRPGAAAQMKTGFTNGRRKADDRRRKMAEGNQDGRDEETQLTG